MRSSRGSQEGLDSRYQAGGERSNVNIQEYLQNRQSVEHLGPYDQNVSNQLTIDGSDDGQFMGGFGAQPIFSDLTLEDFDSAKIQINRVPKTASQTCQGQALIKPIVAPIPFTGLNCQLPRETIKTFKLTERDQEMSQGTKLHKYNHIAQNI